VGASFTSPFRDARRHFLLHDCSPYSHVHVRRERFEICPSVKAIFCRPAPNLNVTIRATFSKLYTIPHRAEYITPSHTELST
jgi:hypothetical protein